MKPVIKYFWTGTSILAAAAAIFFITQIILHYNDKAANALERGKQAVVDIATGDVSVKMFNDEEEETQAENEEITDGTKTVEDGTATENQPIVYDGKARLGIVIRSIGLNRAVSELANRLPSGVTLSFSPYVPDLTGWISTATSNGHEYMLDFPMETKAYPMDDPGPMAILSNAGKAKNMFRLKTVLSITEGYQGLLTPDDEVITKSLVSILPIIDELSKHNTMLVYHETPANISLKQEANAINLSVISHYTTLNDQLSREAIDTKLDEVRRRIMEEEETVLIVANPYPITIKRLDIWLKKLQEQGLQPSPISQLAGM